MPIHDVGYRKWDGQRTSPLSRFYIITETGIRLASKSRWVKRMLFFAWLPVMYWGVGFFVIEQQLEPESNIVVSTLEKMDADPAIVEEARRRTKNLEGLGGVDISSRRVLAQRVRRQFRMIPNVDELADGLADGDTQKTRSIVWSWLLMTFFRYPQALLILFLLGSVTPSLISRDLRSRAFLLYFSRPIGKLEYIFGKFLVPVGFIVFVTTLPALALYVFAILMSPGWSVIGDTWDIPLRIFGCTLALVIPTSTLALTLSSLTHESRFASFAWFAIWALGHGAWMAIWFATAIQQQVSPFDARVLGSATVKNWSVLSLYNNLGDIQSWIFGFESFQNVWPGIIALIIITGVSFVILYRRVSAPIRV